MTFFFYHFSCNLPPSLIICVVLLFACVLSTSLSLYKNLSVPASVIVSSLTRTKAAEPGGFFLLVCVQGFCQGIFMDTAAELISSAGQESQTLAQIRYLHRFLYTHRKGVLK